MSDALDFAAFCAAAAPCDDLAKHPHANVRDWVDPEQTWPVAGRIYPGELIIEDQGSFAPDGRWYLRIGNMEWVNNDLQELERELYSYYLQERH